MDELLASIRPINPAAFGGLPQDSPPQNEAPFDASQYLMQRIMQMKQGKLGALGNVMAAMPQPNQMPSQEGVATA
tara:strand:+ start:1423 stop:1647 length:225 start_codon:yes stop_codon:yes gene_type:complete